MIEILTILMLITIPFFIHVPKKVKVKVERK